MRQKTLMGANIQRTLQRDFYFGSYRNWIALYPLMSMLSQYIDEESSWIKINSLTLMPKCSFSSVQLLSRVRLFATPWIAARQASLSITNSRSSLKLMSTESVTPSSHLILCRPLLLLPPIPPSIRVFSNKSTPHEVAEVLEFQPQNQSFQLTPRIDLL